MSTGERVAAAALACVGARFRAQGRDPATGLDCVGVAAFALGVAVPAEYALRSAAWREDQVPDGLERCDGAATGDVLLCRFAPQQLHVAVRAAGGIVHADAHLRRVVLRPGDPPWPIVAAWRLGEE